MNPNDKDPVEEIDVELDDQPKRGKQPLYDRKKKGSGKRTLLIVAGVVAALILTSGAVYGWMAMRSDNSSEESTQETADENSEPQRQTPDLSPQEAAEMVTFKSDTLNLEFQHRRDWTVTESADKAAITLASPPVGYQTVGGAVPESRGVFTLKIKRGVNQTERDTINNATAIRESELVAYDAPTEVQRHYTNITYAGREDNFMFILVTGSEAYAPGDAISGLSLSSDNFYLIAGGFGEDADDMLQFDPVPSSEANSQTVQQAIAIIKSLKLF
jgi:hypothetical protein